MIFKNKLLFMMYIGVFISKILNAGKTIKCNLHWKETEWILVQCKLFANSYPDSIIRTLLCRWPVVTSLAIHLGYIFCLLGPFWLIQYTSITQSLWVKIVQWPQTKYLDLIMNLRSLQNYMKNPCPHNIFSLLGPIILIFHSRLWVKSDIEPSF